MNIALSQPDLDSEQGWVRAYATLALHIDRHVAGGSGGTVLIYSGPREWSEEVRRGAPRAPGRLVEDADRLLEGPPFEGGRARYLVAHVRALRAVARRLDGARSSPREYARDCLGVKAEWVPESLFESAHERLDRALPSGQGSLGDRLHTWQAAHMLPEGRRDDLSGLVDLAITETRARTSAIVALPEDEAVDCRLVPEAHFLGAGHYRGGHRSTIFINASLPFNLADLLYVVAHEGHPGHIAESILKEIHLVDGKGRLDQQVRFMLAPSFVISEGIGLHAQEVAFPGDDAQRWLYDNILTAFGIRPDGSDFAAVHEARNMLWGVWANAALLVSEGRPKAEVAAYLARWALLTDTEFAAAFTSLKAPGMDVYLHGYHHGWRILRTWLDHPDRDRRVRRLLTEQLLPADLE